MSENKSQIDFYCFNSFNNQNNQINELENNINNLDINSLPTEKEDQEEKPSTKLSEEKVPANKITKKYKFIVVKEENQKQKKQNQSNMDIDEPKNNQNQNEVQNIYNNQLNQSNYINLNNNNIHEKLEKENIANANVVPMDFEELSNNPQANFELLNNAQIFGNETVLGHNPFYNDYLDTLQNQDENEEDFVSHDFKNEKYDSNYQNRRKKKK